MIFGDVGAPFFRSQKSPAVQEHVPGNPTRKPIMHAITESSLADAIATRLNVWIKTNG